MKERLTSPAQIVTYGSINRQGSVLSPFMFPVYIDGIANRSNLRSNLFIVLYADDIILVAPTVRQLQSLFNSCQDVLDSLDMKLNTQKSRCMRINPCYDGKCVEIAVQVQGRSQKFIVGGENF